MKKPITLLRMNLSPRHRPYVRPAGWLLVGLCLALSVSIVTEVQVGLSLQSRLAELEPALLRVREQDRQLQAESLKAGVDVSDNALKNLPVQVGFANQLVAKRTFSWTTFLTNLEETVPVKVSIQSIRVETKGSVIRPAGSARTLQDVAQFARRLEDHAAFANPALLQHRAQDDGHIQFDLTVTYGLPSP